MRKKIVFLILILGSPHTNSQDIGHLELDTVVPQTMEAKPESGLRVKQKLSQFSQSEAFHTLYLPTNWSQESQKKYPVIFEYPGNGPYKNKFGDTNSGLVEDCNLGYGLTQGIDFIWVCLPFVSAPPHKNQKQWWGDIDETINYCQQVINYVCNNYNGDRDNLFLIGFSRGAIACNYIGLHNDSIANNWKGFICHSHYDGVKRWPYPASDKTSAINRLNRLGNRPQFILHESSTSEVKAFLAENYPTGHFTFYTLPYHNHTDSWVLRNTKARNLVRNWLSIHSQ